MNIEKEEMLLLGKLGKFITVFSIIVIIISLITIFLYSFNVINVKAENYSIHIILIIFLITLLLINIPWKEIEFGGVKVKRDVEKLEKEVDEINRIIEERLQEFDNIARSRINSTKEELERILEKTRESMQQQSGQGDESVTDAARFFLKNVLTGYERKHLRTLNNPSTRFSYKFRQSFKRELEHLLQLDLIRRQKDKGLRTFERDKRENNNLHDHFYVTDKGKEYLNLYDSIKPA